MTYLISKINWPSVLAMGVYVVNFIAIIVVVFFERKTPTASLAWIMILALVPVVGFVFYIIFNQNISRYHINRLTEKEEKNLDFILGLQDRLMSIDETSHVNEEGQKWKHLVRLNHNYAKSVYTPGNDIRLFTDGKELFDDMLFNEMKKAQKSINCEYFILKNDYMGKKFINVLTEKAEQGVAVRLLVDSQGSVGINNHVLKKFISAGGNVAYFFPPELAKIGARIGMKINYRNHRKIVVIDDEVAYTGGHNVAKEYIGEKKKFGYWRDTFIKIRGMAVYELLARFILDWRFAAKENLEMDFESIKPVTPGYAGVQIVNCGPESTNEEIKRGYLRMITFAEKEILIQSPYFVPDGSILEALKMAALSGVDVKIMIPCKPDHVFVYWATYSYVGELVRSGAKAYIYDNGFMHAKTITVDGEVSSVGSCNFDNRSFRLNFETNAFVYDDSFAEKMRRAFIDDIEHSHELTLEDYNKRSIIIRFKEGISRLLSEIL